MLIFRTSRRPVATSPDCVPLREVGIMVYYLTIMSDGTNIKSLTVKSRNFTNFSFVPSHISFGTANVDFLLSGVKFDVHYTTKVIKAMAGNVWLTDDQLTSHVHMACLRNEPEYLAALIAVGAERKHLKAKIYPPVISGVIDTMPR